MRLIKLEINGFKSFARKTEIEFEKGVTAIVGPNGSGKSNIADAVRWVLGEQSARVLRGAKMEDVIFNGTEQKKPLAYCEVSLTFDNADGKLNTEFAEVTVTRRVYRSGESEYLINRAACRLKDIGEVFRDTGIGKEGYSIIGQGRVEEILSNKSSERRNAFEEAAGVMKYRVRKEDAERKLENTKKNLQRLGDILEELGNQVGPLEEQSTAAREYLRLRDELKEIEINVFLYQYDKLNERLSGLAETLAQLSGEIEKNAALEGSLGTDCAALEERERALSGAISELQNKLLALTSGVEAKTGESRVVQERTENLLKERERLLSRVAENEAREKELSGSLAAREGELSGNAGRQTAEQDAKYVIEYLRRKEYGRATLLPISAMRPRTLEANEREACRVDGFLGVASELVGYDAKYRGVFENLLGRTVIVRDLDAGIAVNKRARGAFRIATVKGDIINPGGSMTGGSVQKREFSLIGREREIEELKKRMASLAEGLAAQTAEAEAAEASLSGANAAVEAAAEALHKKDVELATQKEKLDIILNYVDEAQEELKETELERAQIRDNIENIDEQRRAAQTDREGLEEGNFATQEDIKKTQEALAALRAEHAAENERATERRVALMALEKEGSAAENERARMRRELAQVGAAIEADRRAAEEALAKFGEMRNALSAIDGTIDAERREVDAHTDRLHAMENERAKHLNALDELRARREAVSAELGDMRERSHKAELNQSRTQMELQTMQDRIWEEYELTYENAQPFRRQIAVTASHIRVDELKKAIRALGDVNVSAIDDYKNVKERYESLSTQCNDLMQAEADLQKLIGELVATMETEFRKQFERIGENFTTTFTELFGGGKAELLLSDKNDILNCDIDIIAQPPGKKLQLLSLLSGGERALTAIALLFAMLKLKPTAFCILDEIETSLDEVNVSNFAEYVKRYSEDTQFILITHRKGSMEVCNALYGVAMEEKGISKIVSARFNESA